MISKVLDYPNTCPDIDRIIDAVDDGVSKAIGSLHKLVESLQKENEKLRIICDLDA